MSQLSDQDGELHLDQSFKGLALQRDDADAMSDICPVCKSSRYLNHAMRFLVNPECYHKMCESCVDRIFSHGPHRCPIAGCTRTLRKHRFREQTFQDVQIEREVDIRKRIAAIFNQREDEFETLLDYNNYLNEVEDITFNLVNGIDVEESEVKLTKYQNANANTISHNAATALREAKDFTALQIAEREQARIRRDTARLEEDEERRAKVEGRQDIINKLASGSGDAEQIAEQGHRVTLKRRKDLREAATRKDIQLQSADANDVNGSSDFIIRGLKQAGPAAPDMPFDAFGGLSISHKYFVLQQDYAWDWLDNIRKDPLVAAGGYSANEFYARAVGDAFAGLGVFVEPADQSTTDTRMTNVF